MSGNAKQIWQSVLERVRGKLTPGAFDNTFRGSSGISLDGKLLWVRAASFYAASAMTTRFKADIYEVLLELLGPDVQVRFEWGRQEEPPDDLVWRMIDAESQQAPSPQQQSRAGPPISPPRAWQQPLLPAQARPPEAERPPSRQHPTKSQAAHPQRLSGGDPVEAQVLPLSFSVHEEARVVDAEPLGGPVNRLDGAAPLPSPVTSPDGEQAPPGSLFEGADQPERPTRIVEAQPWRPWSWAESAPEPSSAEPAKEVPPSLPLSPVDEVSSVLPPDANVAWPTLGAPLQEAPAISASAPEPPLHGHPTPAPYREPRVEFLGPYNQASLPFPDEEGMLNPRYTFETFLAGRSNNFAYVAAQAVSQGEIEGMNPLFIHGGVGLGKTHLLHAIGHVARARGLRVLYTTSENFMNEIVAAIRSHATDQFREKYRQLDMLMVDDVQLIAGKEATEEEFFNTFNTLHMANKHVVLSSDRGPNQIGKLHERLRSRLAWGVQPEIHKPEYELRVALLRFKAERAGLKLSEAVIELFAKPECESVRELESLVSRLLLYTQSEKRNITMAVALELFAAWQQSKKKGIFDLAVVLRMVAQKYGITVEDLLSSRRDRRFAWPRQILMYLLREKAKMKFEQVGAAVGGRDHSTVMHAVDQVTKRMRQDEEFGPQLSALWLEIEDNFPRPDER